MHVTPQNVLVGLDLDLEILETLGRLLVKRMDLGRPDDPTDLKEALALAPVELLKIGQVPRHESSRFHIESFFKAIERLHQHHVASCFMAMAGRHPRHVF
jgi:hypothetical protein